MQNGLGKLEESSFEFTMLTRRERKGLMPNAILYAE